jgi:ABC-type multidrug transport system fused ATPase/permease subunit
VQKELGGIIEETFSAIKLVISFANEDKEVAKFEKLAIKVRDCDQKAEIKLVLFGSLMRFMIFGSYIYSFWLATQLVKD